MNPTEIKAVLNKFGGGANKRLGQHFLIDRATLEGIAAEAPVHTGGVILEIGPGLGVLTQALQNKGCDVVAIERDRRFIGYLEKKLAQTDKKQGTVRIVPGDAIELDWNDVVGDVEWSLVSNLPYSITSFALRKALCSPRPAEHVVVLVQREVAVRAISVASDGKKKGGKTSLLSLMVALSSESSRILRRVPAGSFFPPPKVESAVLEIIPMPMPAREAKWGMDPEKIMAVAKRGFAHPRKFLSSNLGVSAAVLEAAQIPPKARAEDLSPEAWARLAKGLKSP